MLLQIQNLSVRITTPDGPKPLLRGVNVDVPKERIVALVGGSGSGKTTTGLAVLRLLTSPLAVTEGRIIFNDQDIFALSEEKMRQLRGQEISMIFQEPLNALNPVFTIGEQISEVLQAHTALNRKARQARVLELLRQVEIAEPQRVSKSFSHQLSGGMRQRAMIAQAIALNPRLIIADEPTSNLDVTVQARIIELFHKLKSELKASILLIAHDLGLVRTLADDLVVMQAGQVIESGATPKIIASPQQKYTQQLIRIMTE